MTEKERAKAAEENYTRMRKQLDERLNADKRLTAIADKIKAKTADFRDTAEYSELVSNHISAIIQDNIGNISSPLGKQYVCEALLKDHYTAINDVLGNVQVSIDERNGIHIAPQKAPYPAERVAQVAHALEDTTVPFDVIKRRAVAPVANVAKSFHDDYMKENAKFRSDAGLKCFINRTTDGNCCKWCSSIAGRYVYGEEPHDVFRRHDNCGCMTTYENGRERQDVWSKKSWEVPSLTRRDSARARLSTEQARQLQVRNLSYRGLTNGGGSGIIKENSEKAITLITDTSIERIPNVKISGYTDEQCSIIQQQHRELLKYSRDNNENKEVAFVFDNELNNRKKFIGSDDKLDFGSSLYGKDLCVMHNHPRNSSYSTTDLIFFRDNSNVKTFTIVKNNGNVEYIIKKSDFDSAKFKLEYDRLYRKIVTTGTDAEKDKFVRTFLNKTKSGVIWSERTKQ